VLHLPRAGGVGFGWDGRVIADHMMNDYLLLLSNTIPPFFRDFNPIFVFNTIPPFWANNIS